MTLTYGFYNSVAQDRLYNAIQVSQMFDGVIYDGVFEHVGNKFAVLENTGMNINVSSGRSWFNYTWTYNDSALGLTVPTADAVLPRIDIVALEVNSETAVRANSIKVISGTPAGSPVPPTLVRTATINQYPLAHVAVGAGVTSIIQANITNKVGTVDCPYVTGPLLNIQDDSVDDTKLGDRAPQFYRRKGGSSTVWSTGGANNYTPGAVRMQAGVYQANVNAASGSFSVTFPVPFLYAPIVWINNQTTSKPLVFIYNPSTGVSVSISWYTMDGLVYNGAVSVAWLAIGPE